MGLAPLAKRNILDCMYYIVPNLIAAAKVTYHTRTHSHAPVHTYKVIATPH